MGRVSPSFRALLALAMGGMALFVGLPFYYYVGHVYGQQLTREREFALRDLGQSVATAVGLNLGERVREIEQLASMSLGTPTRAELERLQSSYPTYAWIGTADVQGKVLTATGGMLEGQQVDKRPWFGHGLKGSYLGDRHRAELLQSLLAPGASDPLYFIDVAVPLRDIHGQAQGVLAAHLYWRWAAQLVGAVSPGTFARDQIEVFLVDQNGLISYPDRSPGADRVPMGLTAGTPVVTDRWVEGVAYLTVALNVPEALPANRLGWQVVVRQPVDVALAALHAVQRLVLLATVLASLLFVAIAWWMAGVISRPLEVLTRLARRVEQGDETVVFETGAHSAEVRGLSAALESMAKRLIERRHALEHSNHVLEDTVAARTAELERTNGELVRLARHDALTGLPNRRACDERLNLEFDRMRRTGHAYAVMVADVDHFKQINDSRGHAAGDAVLCHVAEVLRGQLRSTDFVGRSGGEEFLVLLPETPPDEALRVAQKLRHALDQSQPPEVSHVTISIGLSVASPSDDNAELAVRSADDQLYRAKQNGRNRVECSFMR